jgi:hypothetical protein
VLVPALRGPPFWELTVPTLECPSCRGKPTILRKRAGAHTAPHWEVVRAKIVLLASEGTGDRGAHISVLRVVPSGWMYVLITEKKKG